MWCFCSFLAVFRRNLGKFCSFGIGCRLRILPRIMCFWRVFLLIFFWGVVKMQYPCESRGLRRPFGGSQGGVCVQGEVFSSGAFAVLRCFAVFEGGLLILA